MISWGAIGNPGPHSVNRAGMYNCPVLSLGGEGFIRLSHVSRWESYTYYVLKVGVERYAGLRSTDPVKGTKVYFSGGGSAIIETPVSKFATAMAEYNKQKG